MVKPPWCWVPEQLHGSLDPTPIVLASLVAQMEKNLPAIQETQVQTLGWEASLEKRITTHSSILA